MITEEKIEQMHISAIETLELTTKDLKEIGFTSHDLTELVKSEKLIRIKIGHYIVPAKYLYNYGKKLLKQKEFDKAYRCFIKCNELDSGNINTLLQLLFQSIERDKLNDAFKYLESMLLGDALDVEKTENYLYLYLFSCIIDIPPKYKDLLQSLTSDDFMLKEQLSKHYNVGSINEIRKKVLEQNFKSALSLIRTAKNERGFSSIREKILLYLVNKASKEKKDFYEMIMLYIENKDYNGIIPVIESEKNKHKLSITLECLLHLAIDYIEIEKTGILPEVPSFNITNTFNAILYRDYKKALNLLVDYVGADSIILNSNVLYKALLDINDLIDKKILNQAQNATSISKKIIIEETEQEETEIEILYSDVVSSLVGKKVETAEDIINKFFVQKGIIKYKYIFYYLLKVGILEGDLSYSKAMIELFNISNTNYMFDVSPYIKEFYIAFSAGEYEIASQYLKIIEESNNFLANKIDVEILKESLKNKQTIKKVVTEKNSVEILSQTAMEPLKKVNVSSVKKMNDEDVDVKLVNSKIQIFETGEDVVILKIMDRARRKKIHGIVASIPSVKSFSIGLGSSRRVVLINSPYLEAKIDKRALANEGNKAYSEHDYNKCIECYRKLLYTSKPNPNIYAKLGLSYMKQNEIEKAVQYLTVATELSKEVDGNLDFTDLISRLTGKPPQELMDRKPKFQMSEKEFDMEENYYGVEYISEISQMVFGEGLNLELACQKFNYDLNQMNIIRLIYAEEYYRFEDYKSGDALVKFVISSKEKSKRVKMVLDKVLSRKKFYKNRPKEREQSLVYMYK